MRIIAGKFRSRKLTTIDSLVVRPTTDRVRQTIFDLLNTRIDFEGCSVLDCFAGSGALGLEALSRGANHITFIEMNAKVIETLTKSIASFAVTNETTLMKMDVMRFIKLASAQYDIIFADPPYQFSLYEKFIRQIFDLKLLKPNGYLVVEHHENGDFSNITHFSFRKNFGETAVSFFKHDSNLESTPSLS